MRQLRRKMCIGVAATETNRTSALGFRAISQRRPGLEPGPIRRVASVERCYLMTFAQRLTAVVMGPASRPERQIGCRANALMNCQTHLRDLAARCARGLQEISLPSCKKRAQGKPDARCTRGLVCKIVQEHAHEHTGPAEAIRLSLRNGFNAYFRALPGDQAFLTPSPRGLRSCPPGRARNTSARLDANH
jgi:hypothetical protein